MKPVLHLVRLTGPGVCVALAACAHYEAKPLTPERNLAQFEDRRLTSAALAEAVRPAGFIPEWPPRTWDLKALTAAALFYNPSLAEARAQWDVARAGIATAAQIPNPVLSSTGPGYNTDTPPDTITPWILNLNIDFPIETAGKRGYRTDRAAHLSEAARLAIATSAWQVRAQVRQAFLDLYAGTRSLDLIQRAIAVQSENVMLLQRQLTAGEISTFQLTQARLILNGLRLQLANADRLRREALNRLATSIGVPVAALSGIGFDYSEFSEVPMSLPGAGVERAALTNRADILAALSNYEASQSALQLEIARQYPDLDLGPGYQMDQDANKWSLLLSAALPVFNRNQGPIAEAEARRTSAAAAFVATQANAIAQVQTALASFGAAVDKFRIADQSVTDTQAQQTTARRQLAAGEIARVDIDSVELEVANAELSRFQALVQVQSAYGAVENAIQRPADIPFTRPPPDPGAAARTARTTQ